MSFEKAPGGENSFFANEPPPGISQRYGGDLWQKQNITPTGERTPGRSFLFRVYCTRTLSCEGSWVAWLLHGWCRGISLLFVVQFRICRLFVFCLPLRGFHVSGHHILFSEMSCHRLWLAVTASSICSVEAMWSCGMFAYCFMALCCGCCGPESRFIFGWQQRLF